MKKLLKNGALLICLGAVLMISGCKDANSSSSKVAKENISANTLPSSNSKTFITSQTGAVNFVKNIGENIDIDDIFDELDEVADFDQIGSDLEEIGYESSYIENLAGIFTTAFENALTSNSININISEKPGKATDFPANYSLDIPQFDLKLNGNVDDVDEPRSGSAVLELNANATASADKFNLSIPVLKVNGKANLSTDAVKQALKADGNIDQQLSGEFSMGDGLKLNLGSFNNNFVLNGNYDGSKGSATAKLSNDISAVLEFDAAKSGIPSLPVKYLKSALVIKGAADGTPAINSNSQVRGNLNYDYLINSRTGFTFADDNGTGGKGIFDLALTLKGTYNLAEFSQFEDIISDFTDELFSGAKLSKEEIDAKNLPFDIKISFKFYDDNNAETLDMINIKSNYDFYSYIYDLLQTLDEDFEDLIYDLEDLIDDLNLDFDLYDYDDDSYDSYDWDSDWW